MTPNFDFRKIQSEFPKAFALLRQWIEKNTYWFNGIEDDTDTNSIGDIRTVSHGGNDGYDEYYSYFNPLELDFFFDSCGIIGTVWKDTSTNPSGIPWHFRTKYDYADQYDSKGFSTRSEALTALWTKEFSLLESQMEEK